MKLKLGVRSGALNLAITGLALLTFMTIHLFQFRFGNTEIFGPYMLRPPPFLINIWGIFSLNLFWTPDTSVQPVGVRDIYKLEYELFRDQNWSAIYIVCVVIFVMHASMGWVKVTPVLGIPKKHIKAVEKMGYLIFIVLGAIYISFPLFCMYSPAFNGHEMIIQEPGPNGAIRSES